MSAPTSLARADVRSMRLEDARRVHHARQARIDALIAKEGDVADELAQLRAVDRAAVQRGREAAARRAWERSAIRAEQEAAYAALTKEHPNATAARRVALEETP